MNWKAFEHFHWDWVQGSGISFLHHRSAENTGKSWHHILRANQGYHHNEGPAREVQPCIDNLEVLQDFYQRKWLQMLQRCGNPHNNRTPGQALPVMPALMIRKKPGIYISFKIWKLIVAIRWNAIQGEIRRRSAGLKALQPSQQIGGQLPWFRHCSR